MTSKIISWSEGIQAMKFGQLWEKFNMKNHTHIHHEYNSGSTF